MANKNQRQVRQMQRSAARQANRKNRKSRAIRKLLAVVNRDKTKQLADEVGVTVPVYLIMRKEATHAEIKRTLLDGDRAGIVRDRDPVAA